jgi:hypothetical protein
VNKQDHRYQERRSPRRIRRDHSELMSSRLVIAYWALASKALDWSLQMRLSLTAADRVISMFFGSM